MSILSDKEYIKNKRVKFFTRSFDLKLYRYSCGLYNGLSDIPVVRLTDQSADGYFYTMLSDTECDIAINVDEDAFIVNIEAVLELANLVVEKGYANAGCPDGGGFCPRSGNPIVTNPFFNIFNLELIRTKFSKAGVKSVHYPDIKKQLIESFPPERLITKYDFDRYEYEPYYQFFFWLAANFNTLYLPSKRHCDGISTILLDNNGNELCMHSWFARFYNMPTIFVKLIQSDRGRQKQRIDRLIHEAYSIRNIPLPSFNIFDYLQFFSNNIIRWIIKVPQRISRWPYKLKRKLTAGKNK